MIEFRQYANEEIKRAFRRRVAAINVQAFLKSTRDRDFMGFFEGLFPFFDELERTATALQNIEARLNYIG